MDQFLFAFFFPHPLMVCSGHDDMMCDVYNIEVISEAVRPEFRKSRVLALQCSLV